MALLLERSTGAKSLGEPAAWARRRAGLARSALRTGADAQAYRIVAQHHLAPGASADYAELEWLAGFIALRRLNDPAAAVVHFERFQAEVTSPISVGRAGYWLGRAYAELGDVERAHAAYRLGAEQQTSYYGLLAAERIGRPFDAELADPPDLPDWRSAAFMKSDVLIAGLMLLEVGQTDLAARFLTHLVEGLDLTQALQLGRMGVDLGQPHLAVLIAKRAAQRGQVLLGAYYPQHPVADLSLGMAPEMVLAISRRESEFNPVVVSPAGARGLMQLMPGTGKLVAGQLGLSDQHSTARLTADWKWNARLGARYLSGLAQRFDGNVVLMAAGYNAGPGRPEQWMQDMGDPRTDQIDMIDWIEMIPFEETRNYVMRVTESLPIYRARLGQPPLPQPFSRELAGSTLLAFAP